MKIFHSWWLLSPTLQQIIKFEDMFPQDKQDIDPVIAFINLYPTVITLPQVIDSNCQQGLVLFIKHMHLLYSAFHESAKDHVFSFAQRLEMIYSAVLFFTTSLRKEKWVSSQTQDHLIITYNSLKQLCSLFHLIYKKEISHISYFSTLVVENFFSLIRRKVRYPCFYEFLVCFRRAAMELIKMNAIDCPYTYPWKRIGKKYNNQVGLQFTMADVKLLFTEEERISHKISYTQPSAADENLCTSLAVTHQPTRKRLTIREATAKENPILSTTAIYYFCAFPGCTRGSPYKYIGALKTHLKTQHNCLPEQVEKYAELSQVLPELQTQPIVHTLHNFY